MLTRLMFGDINCMDGFTYRPDVLLICIPETAKRSICILMLGVTTWGVGVKLLMTVTEKG